MGRTSRRPFGSSVLQYNLGGRAGLYCLTTGRRFPARRSAYFYDRRIEMEKDAILATPFIAIEKK